MFIYWIVDNYQCASINDEEALRSVFAAALGAIESGDAEPYRLAIGDAVKKAGAKYRTGCGIPDPETDLAGYYEAFFGGHIITDLEWWEVARAWREYDYNAKVDAATSALSSPKAKKTLADWRAGKKNALNAVIGLLQKATLGLASDRYMASIYAEPEKLIAIIDKNKTNPTGSDHGYIVLASYVFMTMSV